MNCERITYRRELSPGIILEAQVMEYYHREEEGNFVEFTTLETFTLDVFGVVTNLLPASLVGTEEAFSRMGNREAALWDVVDPKWKVDLRMPAYPSTVVLHDNTQIKVAA